MKDLFVTALIAVSLLTSLTVEGLKKLLSDAKKTYKPNVLAAIVSVCWAVLATVLYVIYFNVEVTSQVIVTGIALVILSFLCSTCGYDKVIQTLKQITTK